MHEFSDHTSQVRCSDHTSGELLQSVLQETIIYKAGETDMTRFLLTKGYENQNESD